MKYCIPLSRQMGQLSLLLFLVFSFSGCAQLAAKQAADYIEPTTGMEFVYIKGGEFLMGDTHGDGHPRELPVHIVSIEDFAVGMYEVTFKEFDKFCDATGREKPSAEGWVRASRPVINVSWHDATAFAQWLSAQSGQTFSLPSETQWEYFARAGTTTSYWMGRKIGKKLATCRDCGSKWDNKSTAPVGSFRPNPFGIYDTAGNVHEWCKDNLHKNYQGAPLDSQPWLGGIEKQSINRGGAWNSYPEYLRSASRDYFPKETRRNDLGFRLIMEQPSNMSK